MSTALGAAPALLAAVRALAGRPAGRLRSSRAVEQGAAYEALHRAALAAPGLREGLTPQAAQRCAHQLRALLGTPALAVCDQHRLLAWEGPSAHHAHHARDHAAVALADHEVHVLGPEAIGCDDPRCRVRRAVVAPLTVAGRTVGTLAAYADATPRDLVRATTEVAQWVSTQLELADLETSRRRRRDAELSALRSQISPHFVYNALSAIASFVRSDPERARDLLLAFAQYTRYSLRRDSDFTTLADELRAVDQYLELERARFGERLQVSLQIAPEVLPVEVPYLCLQPLVENAVRHGLEGRPGTGHVRLRAYRDRDATLISVEDDGVGTDPDRVRAVLSGEVADAVGLLNVDARLRQAYGEDHGLAVRTGAGLGTGVTLRIPGRGANALAS